MGFDVDGYHRSELTTVQVDRCPFIHFERPSDLFSNVKSITFLHWSWYTRLEDLQSLLKVML
jgi:hypothetical protein